jgi:hypothetical protein
LAGNGKRKGPAVKRGGAPRLVLVPMNGTIKPLVTDKGFGFILAGDGFE